MKHFMLPRNTFFKEMNPLSEISSPNPNSHKQKPLRRQKCPKDKENSDPTTTVPDSVAGKPSPAGSGKLKSPLPPRPPSSNPLKRKLSVDAVSDVGGPCSSSDSGVRVIVRMRPLNKDEEVGEMIVQKLSNDSLSINGHNFTFDSVADTEATQQDIFQLVGAPLVENCLAGFNSSVFAYGQTGSGKTYTMWGPANALSEENLLNDQQGLTPRVLERLFARIHEEQVKHADKQLTYQCRCSFLEIYNEQITDLLDPSQKNLQIREDTKSGVYVENLREECVLTMKDVIHLLLKGLANRRTGATSINAESSRSHSVFTCVVESHCKGVSDGKSSFKTSRINLVDLAGSERQKLTGAAGERLKEAGNINRSLSQLGNLINILAEVSQTGKQRHIPYRDSRLTFLLQESLGGNAKMAMICAISPAQSCKSETFSTLRFAQRAKAIKNKAVVNEVVENDVNFLREVIRQLKDELVRLRTNSQHSDPTAAYSNGWSARRSLNLLKLSLSRQMMFPRVDDDGDEEMEIDEEAVEQICNQANLGPMDADGGRALENGCIDKQASEIPDVSMEEATPEIDHSTMRGSSCWNEEPGTDEKVTYDETPGKTLGNDSLAPNLSIVPSDVSPELKSPPLSVSPKVISSSRKSLRTSEKIPRNSGIGRENIQTSVSNVAKKSFSSALTALSGNKGHLTSDHLAASIHRGLEIFDSHRKSSIFGRSSFRFNPAEMKPVLPVEKVEVGVQTLPETDETMEENTVIYLCSDCKSRNLQGDPKEANDTSCLQLVPVDGSLSVEKSKKQVPKAVEKVLAGAIRREMALEDFCSKQTSEIAQLNRLVQQYKHERECNAIIGQMREDKIAQLENLMDGVLPTEEFMEEELASLIKEHELLKEKYDNHPEVLRANIELKHVQDELERYRNFFDLGERDVLVEEVQDLRSQLQYYIDSSSKSAPQRRSLLKLTYSCEPSSSPPLSAIPESTEESAEVKLERERTKWTEVESQWISLADELKMELESSRSLAEKLKRELESEKNCSDELKEAMQLAMEGHARMLEQYADLEEKHMQLLARHRKIQEGIDDVKRAASKAGVKGAESKFINALAGEISALKVEREKERRYMRDEKKALQAQLRDTVEAVQAAGELLVRLKEAEEAVAAAERRATKAEEETEKMCKNIDKLKKKHEREMATLNQTIEESRLPKDTPQDSYLEPNSTKYDTEECQDTGDERWKEEFKDFFDADTELSKFGEPTSWFSGYDRCNI